MNTIIVTEEQRDRLRNIGAGCPLIPTPADDALQALGLVEIDEDGVWPVCNDAGPVYYNDDGTFALRVLHLPVRVTMSSAALQELHSCEYGSYEDSFEEGGVRGRTPEYATKAHIVELIDRSPFKTIVELQSQDEVDEFFAQAVSGTFSLYHPGVCQRVYDELLPLVSDAVPEWIRKSPRIGW